MENFHKFISSTSSIKTIYLISSTFLDSLSAKSTTLKVLLKIINLLMDLSKLYDCVNHELIIAKLTAYRLNKGSLRLIQNYLSKKEKKNKKTAGKNRFFPERLVRNYSRCPSRVTIRPYFI